MVRDGEAGLTLIELLVAMSLFLVAIVMFGGSLTVMLGMQKTDDAYSRANDQAQLALQAIDRQIRSGYVVAAGPGIAPVGADSAVKIYTEAGGEPRCVMWAVAKPAAVDGTADPNIRSLFKTEWDPTGNGVKLPKTLQSFNAKSKYWTTMATDLWNWVVVPGPVQPFTVVTPSNTNILPTLSVVFRLNASRRTAATIDVTSTYTSRNVPRQLESIPVTGAPTKVSVC